MSRPLVIFVDVDDTFVRSFGNKRIPIPSTIDRIQTLFEEKVELYCWSSGGAEYARKSAEEFKIAHCFLGFLPKPNILIDDVLLSDWFELAEVHPNQAANSSRKDFELLIGR